MPQQPKYEKIDFVDPDVGEYQIDLDHPDSFNLETHIIEEAIENKSTQKDIKKEIDEIYKQDEYGIEMDMEMEYGEEEEFRKSGAFSGNYDLDIIQEFPDDEIEASGSK